MINYLKSLGYTFGIIIISSLIITILNYFNILNGLPLKIVELLIPIISIFIESYLIGKTSNKKGYIEGIKYGLICDIIFIIINLLTKSINLSTIFYLVILLLVSALGGVLGINKKKA